MLNDLSKKLLYFLEIIYEEVPHEISVGNLKSSMKFIWKKEQKFKEILDFSTRGKKSCKKGDWEYVNSWEGSVFEFQGEEKILYKGKKSII